MPVFSNVDVLKEEILALSPSDFFDRYILHEDTEHFGNDRIDFVAEILTDTYGVAVNREDILVVGSSKIGFAMHDKFKNGVNSAPAFRSYGVESDIDLSICSESLFKVLWHELSEFACRQKSTPYRSGDLGNYLAYGWLRQDHFPKLPGARLIRCENLQVCRGRVRRNRARGHPKVDFGIFYNIEHLKLYQSRSIRLCRQKLEKPL
ncbi:MAG: hypothetical protein Q7J44_10620 [Pseudotabrizicola sp.]|uniref:hypothetical protein n=1 Tax=Pseudotabrizicola sp. TaxID=2939647 RepID=UPI0027232A87|nr:hypothetical protein [Pseudotabrizicola sp.]MDO9638985.1 hypothetical protein [Pseudotabrizicola sp.]